MNPISRLLRHWGAAGATENARSSVVELRAVDQVAERVASRLAARRVPVERRAGRRIA